MGGVQIVAGRGHVLIGPRRRNADGIHQPACEAGVFFATQGRSLASDRARQKGSCYAVLQQQRNQNAQIMQMVFEVTA